MAVALVRQGYRVHVICSKDKVIQVTDRFDYEGEGVTFAYIPFPRGFNVFKHWKASRQIHQAVSAFSPDIVSIHFTTGIFTTTFAGPLGYKTLGTFHGLGYPVVEGTLKRWLYYGIEALCMRRIDEAWVLNSFDYQQLQKDFAGSRTKVFLQPTKGLGCVLDRFDKNLFSAEAKESLRNSLGIEQGDFVLCFTGRFVFFKGYDKVIRALRFLLEDRGMTNIKLLLIGGKDKAHPTGLTDDEERWAMQSRHIIPVGFTHEVAKYLSITDVFVFPSEKEGVPVCIIEALAMEVPVVTTDARGCNDLVTHLSNGILVNKKPSTRQLAEAIMLLKEDGELYHRLKMQIATERWSLDRENFVEQQVDLFSRA